MGRVPYKNKGQSSDPQNPHRRVAYNQSPGANFLESLAEMVSCYPASEYKVERDGGRQQMPASGVHM